MRPLRDSKVLPSPFSIIRKAEGDPVDALYASTIQGSYSCRQTAASSPILVCVPGKFEYTGKRPEGVRLVLGWMRTVSTVAHPGLPVVYGMVELKAVGWPYHPTVVRRLGVKNARGADKNLLMKEIFERSMFDGIVSFAGNPLRSGFVSGIGRSMPYNPNKPRRKS